MSAEIADRTNRFARTFFNSERPNVSDEFGKFSLGITAREELLQTYCGQAILVTLVNLMVRFHPHIVVEPLDGVGTKVWLPFGWQSSLSDSISNIAMKLGSTVEFARTRDLDILVSIGPTENRARHSVCLSSDGWKAYFSNSRSVPATTSEENNPIGGLLAASFGAAEVFRKLIELIGSQDRRILRQPKPFSFSALDYSVDNESSPNPQLPLCVDVGEIAVIGAGGVANSLLYSLAMIPGMQGLAKVVDPDTYDSTNMNRCLHVCKEHVGIPKVQALASVRCALRAAPFTGKYSAFRRQQSLADLVVSTVDNNDARIQIQCDLPRIILHGATGENVATIFRSDFLDGACLGCLFYEAEEPRAVTIGRETGLSVQDVERLLNDNVSLTREDVNVIAAKTGHSKRLYRFIGRTLEELYAQEICGVMHVEVGEEEIAGTVSFVSAIPGILLAGEVVKTRTPGLGQFSLNNYLTMSAFTPGARWFLKKQKDPRCKCFCSSSTMIDSYRNKWSFRHLSDP